jgi:hypothetical protein
VATVEERIQAIWARYQVLSGKLAISLHEIDKELMSCPQLVQQCAELSADANSEELEARLALDITTARASDRLRTPGEGKKVPSETQIAACLPLEDDVQQARSEFDATKHLSSVCSSLVGSMREKVRLIGKACDMTVAGYVTPSSYAPRRTQLMQKG